MATASSVLARAAQELGYCRWDDPEAGTKYGRWYADITGSSYFGTSGVPFCAMFVSYILDQCGVSANGFPTASCATIRSGAKNAGKWVSGYSGIAAGDVVLYDWGGDGAPDHTGFVEKVYGTYIQAIEGNTTGSDGRSGSVARKTRSFSTIIGYYNMDYGSSSGSSISSSSSSGAITVDGLWGSNTTLLAQKVAGTTQDGIVSSQNSYWKSSVPGCTTGWEWLASGYAGSKLIIALQKKWGVTADGLLGKDTINAMIKYYMAYGSGATVCDGKLDYQSKTIKAFQTRLNAGSI